MINILMTQCNEILDVTGWSMYLDNRGNGTHASRGQFLSANDSFAILNTHYNQFSAQCCRYKLMLSLTVIY